MFLIMYNEYFTTHYSSLSVILISQLEKPALAFGTDVICESSTVFGMTNEQVQMCKNYSQLMPPLFSDTFNQFHSNCYSQFKHERWNCSDITPPIFGARKSPFLSLRELYESWPTVSTHCSYSYTYSSQQGISA